MGATISSSLSPLLTTGRKTLHAVSLSVFGLQSILPCRKRQSVYVCRRRVEHFKADRPQLSTMSSEYPLIHGQSRGEKSVDYGRLMARTRPFARSRYHPYKCELSGSSGAKPQGSPDTRLFVVKYWRSCRKCHHNGYGCYTGRSRPTLL